MQIAVFLGTMTRR